MPDPSTTTLAHFPEMVQTIEGPGGATRAVKYRLMSPEDDRPGEKFPLLIFLHGAGERGTDNRKQLLYLPETLARPENRKRYSCFCIVPQCPPSQQWVNVPWSAKQSTPLPPLSEPLKTAQTMVNEVLHNWPIDAARVYLVGMSMGGYGTWDWAIREPARFAAIAPICGGGDETKAALLKDVPVWAVHGDRDDAVPVERSRAMVEAVRAAGGDPKYSELAGVGHNCWSKAFTPAFGLLDWLFQQRRKA